MQDAVSVPHLNALQPERKRAWASVVIPQPVESQTGSETRTEEHEPQNVHGVPLIENCQPCFCWPNKRKSRNGDLRGQKPCCVEEKTPLQPLGTLERFEKTRLRSLFGIPKWMKLSLRKAKVGNQETVLNATSEIPKDISSSSCQEVQDSTAQNTFPQVLPDDGSSSCGISSIKMSCFLETMSSLSNDTASRSQSIHSGMTIQKYMDQYAAAMEQFEPFGEKPPAAVFPNGFDGRFLEPPISSEEDKRRAKLARTGVLNVDKMKNFDTIVNLTAKIFKSSYVLVTLVEGTLLHVKA